MPEQNVEVVRRMWAAWTSEDMSGWLAFFHPEVAWQTREDEPDAGVYHGREGVLLTTRDGRIVEVREFASRAEGLEAAGLDG
jgi:ketosteroid isomerase-like protein